MEYLKPCPFCGNFPAYGEYNGGFAHIECTCRMNPHATCFPSLDDAISAWNTRAERTCTINEGSGYDELLEAWFWHLSCGHMSEESVNPPAYCPKCGAKVIS